MERHTHAKYGIWNVPALCNTGIFPTARSVNNVIVMKKSVINVVINEAWSYSKTSEAGKVSQRFGVRGTDGSTHFFFLDRFRSHLERAKLVGCDAIPELLEGCTLSYTGYEIAEGEVSADSPIVVKTSSGKDLAFTTWGQKKVDVNLGKSKEMRMADYARVQEANSSFVAPTVVAKVKQDESGAEDTSASDEFLAAAKVAAEKAATKAK